MTTDLVARARRARFRSKVLRAPSVRLRYRGLNAADALLVSYPRSGTTWMRFLLSEILTGKPADFADETAAVPYIGDHRAADPILPGSGRLVMSHELVSVGDRRVVYVVRDPRAVALSEFRWLRRRGLTTDDLDAFIRDFVRGRSNPWGAWSTHVDRWRTSPSARSGRLHLVRYEDLRTDPVAAVRDVVTSLGLRADIAAIEVAIEHNSIDAMRDKEDRAPDAAFAKGVDRSVRFVNAGSVAGWRQGLTSDQIGMIERGFGATMCSLGYEPVGTGSGPRSSDSG